MPKNKILRFLLVIFVITFGIGLPLAWYLIFTTHGSTLLVKFAISRYVASKEININKIQGHLSQGLTLSEVELGGLKGLPAGSVFKIQQLRVSLHPFKFDSLNFEIENGRLVLPHSEPIVLFATYKKVKLDVNIYSRRIDAKEILNLFVNDKSAKNISGVISNVDSYVGGSFTRPQLTGVFEVDSLSYKGFSIKNCPGSFAIDLKGKKAESNPQGAIVLQQGDIIAQGTNIKIRDCKIIFSPDLELPSIDFKGSSIIGSTKIEIALSGTRDEPKLTLTSSQPHLPGTLLLMLVTGKEEKELQVTYQGQITTAQARDLLDYFFSGAGSDKVIDSLGVNKVALTTEAPATKAEADKAQPLLPGGGNEAKPAAVEDPKP